MSFANWKHMWRITFNLFHKNEPRYDFAVDYPMKWWCVENPKTGIDVRNVSPTVSWLIKEQVMNLAIFDIDGTLTNTNSIDEKCFLEAFSLSFSITGIDTDWTKYPSTTDSGITLQIFQERFGRAPNQVEIESLKRCFVSLLKECRGADSMQFAEVPGAAVLLNRFTKEPLWAIAIATGSWRESAILKLKAATIEINRFPAASADDGNARDDILRIAVARALTHYRQTKFERMVSIGDGVWDVVTAARLGIPFLGIGTGSRAKRLLEAGASHILEDHRDYDQFIQCLREAEIPNSSRTPLA